MSIQFSDTSTLKGLAQLYAKEIGLKKKSAIFSGMVFAFSSYLTVWLEYGNIGHAILWLPLALYLVEKLVKNFDFKKTIFLTLVLTASILAGYIQVSIYLFGTVLAYFLYRFAQTGKKKHCRAYRARPSDAGGF